jgi:hypothetical protein
METASSGTSPVLQTLKTAIFVSVGHNAVGVQICTWGMIGTITWAAIAKYATSICQGELHVALSLPARVARAISAAYNRAKALILLRKPVPLATIS